MSGRTPVQMSDIEIRGNALTDSTLEATREMKRLAAETREIGAATAQNLDRQGEQLNNIENNLDEINADLHKAEKHLTNMEKCCGICLCPCARPKGVGGTKTRNDKWKAAQSVNNGGTVTTQPHGYQKEEVAKTGYIKRITNDAREDEMDENLAVVADVVGDLKMMAMDMGSELERQNAQLDRINVKTDCNVNRVQDAEARTNKLLNS
ncbi:hypothetical protein ACHWQZ_G001107 [Mnemiopsis leidyi]